jgi:hypothetical protein
LARACESFELCSHFKSLPPVSDRELSTNLTWRAHRRKPEFPALGSETQSRCVQGERGVKSFCSFFSVPKDEPVLSAIALGLGSSTPKRRPGYLRRSSC